MSDASVIHPSATIAQGSRIDAFATIGSGCVLADDVHVGSGARLLDGARVDHAAEIGSNAVVMAGVRIERHAVVEPGSVVADGVPANAIVRGNPARIVGYVGGAQDAPAPRRCARWLPASRAACEASRPSRSRLPKTCAAA